METKDTGKKSSERMTRTQKVIVILTAAILTIILIAVATTRYMGSPGVYPIEADQGTSSSEENAVPSEKDKQRAVLTLGARLAQIGLYPFGVCCAYH